ncbi:hypothetical protein JTE90_001581 [Oedothorax gibbosus]|uniref:Elongation of very long chain fatty acids protein n=1 Tax=Oedothorax gibbosus TaxID=931172 RepID=A0AAV6VLH7_9ARAC|nr:hypothetical protein JTE90_001581 [Oedothorax gibbosus]
MLLETIYEFVFNDDIDNKVLVQNSYALATFVAIYVMFVTWVGPALMKNRKPFDLQKILISYNLAQMAVNGVLVYQLLQFGYEIWDDRCMVQQSSRYPYIVKCSKKLMWYTYLVKLADSLDTVFFVLRKKNNQISFLHVFHHVVVWVLNHSYLKYIQIGYYLLVTVAINNFVHVIMYFYYALAAIGPSMRKYLWWKKYLTLLQMIQFLVILTYISIGFITGCEKLGAEEIAMATFLGLLVILFMNFYRKSFKKHVE